MLFLERNYILYKHQYGFRAKHSTVHPVVHLLKDISVANDKITKGLTRKQHWLCFWTFHARHDDILLTKLFLMEFGE